jgi:hypothetical protein
VIIRTVLAAVAIVAVPIAVQGAEGPRTTRPAAKRTCEVDLPTGSRLGGIRRCRSAEEREAAKQEARTTVDRIQAFKATTCPPNC